MKIISITSHKGRLIGIDEVGNIYVPSWNTEEYRTEWIRRVGGDIY